VGEAEEARQAGQIPDAGGLSEAESLLRDLLEQDPQNAPAHDLLRQLQQLKPVQPGS
jgi:hypothetical protein